MPFHKLTAYFAVSITALAAALTFDIGVQAQDQKPLVIVDGKGDRGLPAPFIHHKNGPGYLNSSYLFDTLIGQNKKGELVPALATSWQLADDRLSVDIHLHQSAKWHDGTAVTAKDVIFTFAYMAKHGYAFVSLDSVDKVDQIATNQLRLTLKKPDAALITRTLVSMPILPEHIYGSQSDPLHFTDTQAVIGSGPYKFVKYDKAQGRYVFEANPSYYNGQPKFAQIALIKMGGEPAIQAMKKGAVDIIPNLPYSKIQHAQKAGLSILTTLSNHPYRMAYNHTGLFQEKILRQGLAYAIDRQKLVDVAFRNGAGIVANSGYYQHGSPWLSDKKSKSYDFDTVKASDLLTQAGWSKDTDGKWVHDDKIMTLRLISEPRHKGLATALSDQLQDFGLSVDLRLLAKGAMIKAAKSRDFDLALFFNGTMGDPGGAKSRVMGKSWSGDHYHASPAMKNALIGQQIATDDATRLKHLHAFQALYAEELPSYFLVNPVWAMAYNKRVSPEYLPNGIAIGIPSAMHKSLFLK